jgi:Tfp pilus assembly protein PilN
MKTINLLPSSYKEELSQEENWKLVLILGILFLIFLISLALVLFSIKIYVQGQADSLKIMADLQEKALQTSGIPDLKGKINLSNQKILKLESFYKAQPDTPLILEDIFKTLPATVYLTNLTWQKSVYLVSLAGFSPTREALFELKTNLEAKKEFKEVYFPPADWINPSNIDFEVTFKIVSE